MSPWPAAWDATLRPTPDYPWWLNGFSVKVKVKFVLEQVTKAQAGSRGIAFPSTSALDGVRGQRHAPAAFWKGPVPNVQGIGGPVASRYNDCPIQ